MVVAHGSLDDPAEYVRTGERAEALLRALPAGRLLVLGHTHHPWLYGAGAGTSFPAVGAGPPGSAAASLAADTRHLVNPGAVGQSRERETEPRARFALVDLARAHVSFFAEPYDAAATRAALRSRRLPGDAVHVRPGRVAAATRRAGRLLSLASASIRA
jgi:hypothetical protein